MKLRTQHAKPNSVARLIAVAATMAALLTTGCPRNEDSTGADFLPFFQAGTEQSLASRTAGLSGYSVKLERVRYCKNWLCTKGITSGHFSEWEYENVDRGKQRDTYIARVSQPSRSSVENVVFISAGQQTTLDGNGYNNVVTGQPVDYKKNCKGTTAYCYRTLDGRSFARRVLASGLYPTSKTLFIVVFDAQFNYMTGTTEKQKIENAYYKWITNRTYSYKLKNILFAGQSRGGCLAFRLAKRFRSQSAYSNAAMILQGYDAVCSKQQSEFSVTGTKFTNPLKSNYYGWYVNMYSHFPNKDRLAINLIVGGDQVVDIAPFGVRAFVYQRYNSDYGWYRQRWVNVKHKDMGRNYSYASQTVDPGMAHLEQKFAEFQ